MDTNYPGNSRKAAVERTEIEINDEEAITPKLEPVVTGRVIRRKRTLTRRFKDAFFGGDGVMSYLGKEVLLPALQDLFIDFVRQGAERAVYGEVRSTGRSTRSPSPTSRTHISYDRYSRPAATRDPEPPRRPATHPSAFDVHELIVGTRSEAEDILTGLEETIHRYGATTVANLKELMRETSEFTDHKWGWTDLRDARISRIREGYLIRLPEPEDLR